jgi:hypothetical protein
MFTRVASFALAASCLVVAHAPSAEARESAYCRKVKARAASDALLLMTPKIVAQALRFPSSGRIDAANASVGDDIELRAGLAYSPVDALRGSLLSGIGDADCRQHAAGRRIDDVLVGATDRPRLSARSAERDYLRAHRAEWQSLLDAADGELKAGLLTVTEIYELHRLTQALERRLIETENEVSRLTVVLEGQPTLGPTPLARGYVEQTAELERKVATLRRFDPWSFTITGGVVPLGHNAPDWFGFAEVSFSLGGALRESRESSYLQAREDEVRTESYELPSKLALFRKVVAADLSSAQRELASVQAEVSFAKSAIEKLNAVDAPNATQSRATLTLQRISAEADEVLLRTQIRELAALAEGIRES